MLPVRLLTLVRPRASIPPLNMSFQGSIKELPVPDIVQLMSVSGKTGVFTLTRGPERGVIYLKNGQMVHSRLG